MLTGVRDVDIVILNKLEDKDLVNVCQTNKLARDICNSQGFWLNRIRTKFPYIPIDVLNKYKKHRTWSDYYIKDLRKLNGVDPNTTLLDGSKGGSKGGRLDHVLIALANGANVNAVDRWGDTALTRASLFGHRDMVRVLLKGRADPNQADVFGETALMSASMTGDIDIVRILLDNGAEVNAVNIKRITPLRMAADNKHTNVVRMLLEEGANPNTVDIYGDTPLIVANTQENTDIIQLLKHHGAH